MKKLDFLYFDAGGGHRAAANALSQVISQQGRELDVRLVNLQEMLDKIDIFRKLTGLRLQDVYNVLLKKGWTLGSPQLMKGMHLVIRLFHSKQVKLLEQFWKRSRPDMVVSLIPNFNRAIGKACGGRSREFRWSASLRISRTIRRISGWSSKSSTSSAAPTGRQPRRQKWATRRNTFTGLRE